MDPNITPLERAFQIAQSGACQRVADLKRQMKAEGYSVDQIEGPALARQLRSFIARATGSSRA